MTHLCYDIRTVTALSFLICGHSCFQSRREIHCHRGYVLQGGVLSCYCCHLIQLTYVNLDFPFRRVFKRRKRINSPGNEPDVLVALSACTSGWDEIMKTRHLHPSHYVSKEILIISLLLCVFIYFHYFSNLTCICS
jgi:hypothetical protein